MFCTECRAQVGMGEKFCGNCGSRLEVAPSPFCSSCGKNIAEQSSFCEFCGAPQAGSVIVQDDPSVPASSAPAVPAAIAAARPVALAPEIERKTRQMAMFLHLSMLAGFIIPFAGLLVPILTWQMKKDELPLIDAHGKNAVNWIISGLIYTVICLVLSFLLIGIPLSIALGVVSIVFPIMAAIKGNNGEVWTYPLAISFFK